VTKDDFRDELMNYPVPPFSNGTESLIWREINCFQCIKQYSESQQKWHCKLEKTLDAGLDVDLETLKTMGIDKEEPGVFGICQKRILRQGYKPKRKLPIKGQLPLKFFE
jgi:hypothetical protein